jgi:beta-N-acetylhexosaminidase
MTAHISFPQIETENLPSTLSKTFLTDILRNQLGFNGLIITDSLEMKAIKNQYSMGDAAVMAINAGANLIIIGSGSDSNYFDHLNAYYSVLTAVKNGTIPYETLYNSVKLILEYKEKYKVLENPYPMDSIDSIDYSLHKSFAQQVSLKSITLIQDKRNLLPITSDTLVISNLANIPLGIDQNDSQAKNSIAYILAKKIGSNYMTLPSNPTSDNIQSFVSKAKEYDKVIIATYMANSHYEAITSIARANPNTILLLLGSPYDLSMFTNISTIICAYEYTPLSTESLIKVLTGEAEAMGRLPVELE